MRATTLRAAAALVLGTSSRRRRPRRREHLVGRPSLGSRRPGDDQAGGPDVHRGCPVHRELRLQGRRGQRVRGLRRALRRQGHSSDTNGCNTPPPAAWHAGPLRHRRQRGQRRRTVGPGRLVYSSWRHCSRDTNGNAACNSTTSPWCASTATTEGRSIRSCPSGEGPPASARVRSRPVTGSTATATRRCVAVPRGSAPSPAPWSRSTRAAADRARSHRDPRRPRPTPEAASSTPAVGLGTLLSTVAIAPLAGSNGVGDLDRQLEFAQRLSGIRGLRLAQGTQEFSSALG